jgi:hypothetical protein
MDVGVLEDTPTVTSPGNLQSCEAHRSQMIHNIPQPTFEELVASYLVKEGVEVRKNHSFIRCEQVR